MDFEMKEPTSALTQDTSLSHMNASKFAESHCETNMAHGSNISEQEFNFLVENLSVDSDSGSESSISNSDFVAPSVDAPKRQQVRKKLNIIYNNKSETLKTKKLDLAIGDVHHHKTT